MLTVTLERVLLFGHLPGDADNYEVHPYSGDFLVRAAAQKKATESTPGSSWPARSKDTGTITIKLETAIPTVLAEVSFKLDSRKAKPVFIN
jgi:hypothetical protein